jgi:hypothetical protein
LYLAANINTAPDILEKLKTTLQVMQQDGTVEKFMSEKD